MRNKASEILFFLIGGTDITQASQPAGEHLMEEFAAQGLSGLERTQQ